LTTPLRATRAEISLKNLRNNLLSFREHINDRVKLMAVVKADGYGHGAIEIAKASLEYGANWLGVAFVEEGIQLRKSGLNVPILVFNPPFKDQYDLFFELDLTPTLYSNNMADSFSRLANKYNLTKRVHLKADTGMGRVGFFPYTEAVPAIEYAGNLPGLTVEGFYTHFATADEKDKGYARKQLARFMQVVRKLKSKGICPPILHTANSAAAMEIPQSWLNLVRLGISMYGHYPSPEISRDTLSLKPLMNLKSKVSHLKSVPPGTCISYGCTYVTEKNTRVATIPLGYGDGYSRLLSNKAEVLIRGRRFPVIGRICMDQFMVDVSSGPEIQEGDEVVLIGNQGTDSISTEEIANLLGTINYEVLCSISRRVPRVYI